MFYSKGKGGIFMKKFLCLLLLCSLFISILRPINITFAAYNDNLLEDELQKQKQIESIFSEMNRLICEKAHTKYLLE